MRWAACLRNKCGPFPTPASFLDIEAGGNSPVGRGCPSLAQGCLLYFQPDTVGPLKIPTRIIACAPSPFWLKRKCDNRLDNLTPQNIGDERLAESGLTGFGYDQVCRDRLLLRARHVFGVSLTASTSCTPTCSSTRPIRYSFPAPHQARPAPAPAASAQFARCARSGRPCPPPAPASLAPPNPGPVR